jgi:hypothetical protein
MPLTIKSRIHAQAPGLVRRLHQDRGAAGVSSLSALLLFGDVERADAGFDMAGEIFTLIAGGTLAVRGAGY